MAQRLLIIDDSLMLLRFAASVLSAQWPDLEIVTAKRGAEGCARAQSQRPDLILLDHVLPDLPGEEVCRRLHQSPEASDVPVVMMTSAGSEAQGLEARHVNVVKTISKPFTPELLVATVRSLLDDEQARRVTPLVKLRERFQLPAVASPATAPVQLPAFATGKSIVFRGSTDTFSLRAALQTVSSHRLTGCLRVHPPKGRAVEIYAREGGVILATTRETLPLRERAAALARQVSPVLLESALQGQADTGCPFPILLGLSDAISPELVREWTERLGLLVFAQLWLQPPLEFEFEEIALPEWAQRVPGPFIQASDWVLASLRSLDHTEIPPPAGGDFSGLPAYTRAGYEIVSKLPLSDYEHAFALRVNGETSLAALAESLGLRPVAAYALLFRFLALGVMEYWPAEAVVPRPADAVRISLPTSDLSPPIAPEEPTVAHPVSRLPEVADNTDPRPPAPRITPVTTLMEAPPLGGPSPHEQDVSRKVVHFSDELRRLSPPVRLAADPAADEARQAAEAATPPKRYTVRIS